VDFGSLQRSEISWLPSSRLPLRKHDSTSSPRDSAVTKCRSCLPTCGLGVTTAAAVIAAALVSTILVISDALVAIKVPALVQFVGQFSIPRSLGEEAESNPIHVIVA
jgi:hypothetical protein